jgi:hypothetical protein
VLETVELDVDEVEEEEVNEEPMDETVELVVHSDEAIEDAKDDVKEVVDADEGEVVVFELDEPGACKVMTAASVTSVSTAASATIA